MTSRIDRTGGGVGEPLWALLYAATFALQALCGFARASFFVIPLGLLLAITGVVPLSDQFGNSPVTYLCLVIGAAPLLYSLLTLAHPMGAGSYWCMRIGGRAPSAREREIYEAAVAALRQRDPTIRAPTSWFVLDEWDVNAAVLGDTLMLTAGTLNDTALTPVLAHELAHFNTIDGRLSVALNRFAVLGAGLDRLEDTLGENILVNILIITRWVWSGELPLMLAQPLWDAWFRSREFRADQYAAHLGQAHALADVLERHALLNDHPIPYRFLSGASHPSTEHRIQDLLNHDRQPQGATA